MPGSGRPPVGDTPTDPSCRLDPPQKTRSRSVRPAAVNPNHQMSVMYITQDWRTFQFYYFVCLKIIRNIFTNSFIHFNKGNAYV